MTNQRYSIPTSIKSTTIISIYEKSLKNSMEVEELCKAVFKERDSLTFDQFKKGCEEVTSEMFLSVYCLLALHITQK
jgi:hypothetical protein